MTFFISHDIHDNVHDIHDDADMMFMTIRITDTEKKPQRNSTFKKIPCWLFLKIPLPSFLHFISVPLHFQHAVHFQHCPFCFSGTAHFSHFYHQLESQHTQMSASYLLILLRLVHHNLNCFFQKARLTVSLASF